MNLPYFYHKELTAAETLFTLTEETSKHCVQVLRMQEGTALQLTNGKGLKMLVHIHTAHKKNCLVKAVSFVQDPEPSPQNSIAISLLKNTGRFEWFLEKATELGIHAIVPLLCKRTERQLFKRDRFESIIISAMLQSQQSHQPHLHEPVRFESFIPQTSIPVKFIAHCEEEDKTTLQSRLEPTAAQLILIGPEGDFTPDEISLALQNQFLPVSLGTTRLRTETAGIVAATLLQIR